VVYIPVARINEIKTEHPPAVAHNRHEAPQSDGIDRTRHSFVRPVRAMRHDPCVQHDLVFVEGAVDDVREDRLDPLRRFVGRAEGADAAGIALHDLELRRAELNGW
jgi:hypothetical protein